MGISESKFTIADGVVKENIPDFFCIACRKEQGREALGDALNEDGKSAQLQSRNKQHRRQTFDAAYPSPKTAGSCALTVETLPPVEFAGNEWISKFLTKNRSEAPDSLQNKNSQLRVEIGGAEGAALRKQRAVGEKSLFTDLELSMLDAAVVDAAVTLKVKRPGFSILQVPY